MSDWTTTAATAATAVGTLVLAVATFSSVRSAQRSARASEAALLAGIRPVLVASRLEDPPQKVGFQDDHWAHVAGGRASVEVTDQAIYLLVSLRNVGNGLAVLDRWELMPDRVREERAKGEEESFRRLTRDIYVAPGDLGFWQGTLRDPNEDLFKSIRKAAARASGDDSGHPVPGPRRWPAYDHQIRPDSFARGEVARYRRRATGTSTDPEVR